MDTTKRSDAFRTGARPATQRRTNPLKGELAKPRRYQAARMQAGDPSPRHTLQKDCSHVRTPLDGVRPNGVD